MPNQTGDPMALHIRYARPEDAGPIALILRELGWFTHLVAEPFENTRQRLHKRLALCLSCDSHTVYVAEDETGQVAAYAVVHWLPYLLLPAPEGYVSDLFVRQSTRGQGAGTQLLAAIKAEATARGCSRLSLLNNKARQSYQRGFYQKNGWQERPEMLNFIYPLSHKTETP